ncbi:hypothetical protein RhiirA4_452660 [Rhizophagus irregularis]|uniref:Uncharacterized protein n=1 Tax=Rhizophagus irregularis TaxID=588596 RepID=A0A2I1FYL6_9GLOM|nr:hypothetical protein RhiirA4_452660 [Rhizophagus irregularis]
MNEIIRLFVNDENTNITHLYIPNCQIHLIPEAKRCFSEIEFLSCNTKTIKVSFLTSYDEGAHDILFCEVLENSLIKHANTIQHFKITKQPTTQILSYLINLRGLELASDFYNEKWHCLENLSTHFLQILRARRVSVKPLARLIENTSGLGGNILNNRIIIQAICKKCPNLKYLKLSLRSANILELEKLLINCQYLEGLYILKIDAIDWGNLFEILAKSSPNRHPMLLHFIQILQFGLEHKNLIEKYKEEGIVKFLPTIFLMKILMGLKEKYNYLYMLNFIIY